ncbi:hypothetical protein M885DRAFT_28335 [Pelagophyceae sp. CCMP2097]|nr:hypothetical protein M885DRAFT_28335 [Pelagophyceae sp. CCMP2097]
MLACIRPGRWPLKRPGPVEHPVAAEQGRCLCRRLWVFGYVFLRFGPDLRVYGSALLGAKQTRGGTRNPGPAPATATTVTAAKSRLLRRLRRGPLAGPLSMRGETRQKEQSSKGTVSETLQRPDSPPMERLCWGPQSREIEAQVQRGRLQDRRDGPPIPWPADTMARLYRPVWRDSVRTERARRSDVREGPPLKDRLGGPSLRGFEGRTRGRVESPSIGPVETGPRAEGHNWHKGPSRGPVSATARGPSRRRGRTRAHFEPSSFGTVERRGCRSTPSREGPPMERRGRLLEGPVSPRTRARLERRAAKGL